MSPLVTASPSVQAAGQSLFGRGVRRNFCGLYQFCLSSVPNSGYFAAAPLSLTAASRQEPEEAAALYEPDPQTVFDAIIPEYLGGVVYGALCESVASELAARRTAMDAATKNADEMIGNLNLQFNRARQGAITQEITEIVAGAEA